MGASEACCKRHPIHIHPRPPLALARLPPSRASAQIVNHNKWQTQSQTNLASSAHTCPPAPTRSSPIVRQHFGKVDGDVSYTHMAQRDDEMVWLLGSGLGIRNERGRVEV